MNIFEMPVIPHEGMVEKIYNRLPKTKNKRIRKKWKKLRWSEIPRKDALIFACGIVCHPTMVERVEEGLKVARNEGSVARGFTSEEHSPEE